MGFTFDNAAAAKGEAEPISEMDRLITADPRNAERIAPYLGGEEINNSPTHAHPVMISASFHSRSIREAKPYPGSATTPRA